MRCVENGVWAGVAVMRIKAISLIVFAVGLAVPATVSAQQDPSGRRSLTALRIDESAIEIDGRLDEAAWSEAPSSDGFTQRDPDDGAPATERTEVRVLLSDDAIYIAVRAFDSDPGGIVSRLARRDQSPNSDHIAIFLDAYHDRRSSFAFAVGPSGAIMDGFYTNDRRAGDFTWDPVWQVATSIDELGWIAEFRIPLSQLRFAEDQVTWGFQVKRVVSRKNEESFWAPYSKASNGFASLFGELQGLTDLPSPRRIELRPYVVAQGRRRPESNGSVYAPVSAMDGSVGFDLKYGLSSDFTLDLTANPDFGQVEADPAVVNLTAFESFFPERRPFFVEGASLFNQSVAGGQLFYSRRIGRRPQGFSSPPDGGTIEIPDGSTIVSAAKVTGKSSGGLGLGLLSALTTHENGTMRDASGDVVGSERVQPWVHHFAGRVEQDFRDGQHTVGTMVTALNRLGGADDLGLRRSAYAMKVDGTHKWRRNMYNLEWNIAGSRIRGTEAVILGAQRSSFRYFQRPDADHLSIDDTRTSLGGYSLSLRAGKQAGTWRYYMGVDRTSPGFDVTDLGFLFGSVDNQTATAGIGYNQVTPAGPFRTFRFGLDAYSRWTTAQQSMGTWVRPIIFSGTLRNNWGFNVSPMAVTVGQRSVNALRGGPSLRQNTWHESLVSLFSNRRKPLSFNAGLTVGGRFGTEEQRTSVNAGVTLLPNATVNARIDIGYSRNTNPEQWITSPTIAGSTRYVLASIRQQTLNTGVRLDWTLSPRLSFQLFAQPFVSSGEYSSYLEVDDPEAERWTDRFHFYGDEIACAESGCEIDRDSDGIVDASFARPDFNLKSLRMTSVLRWEYSPGSVLFIAWQHGRSARGLDPEFGGFGAVPDLFRLESDNTLLIKINYWLGS